MPFMKKIIWCIIISLSGFMRAGFSQSVHIAYSKASLQEAYAAGMVEKSLLKKGYSLKGSNPEFEIRLTINKEKLGSEAYSVVRDKNKITVTGGDERGIIYGSLSIAEDVRNGIGLKDIKPRSEKTKL